MSLYAELKRRNVFRVGVFYLVSSWLILQVADVLFGVLRLPDWTLTFVAALLVLGFVPAVILSWVYEMTPEGIKKESEIDRSRSITPETGKRLDRIIILMLVAVIAVLLVDRFLGKPQAPVSADDIVEVQVPDPTAATAEAASSTAGTQDLSVAVLPFANMSSDEENEYFADGLTEELLNALAQIEALKVAGRTSSFYFKGKNEDLRSIGAQLGVAHVLEGSVRKAGDRVRITAQLIKVDDGFHLWSDSFDRDLSDIFQVQEEISLAIAEALRLELGLEGERSVVVTENLEAYQYYLEGRARVANRNDLVRAIELLERATELDPEFAEAWGQLAQAYSLGHYYAFGSVPENLVNAQEAAERALALEPDLASALSAWADVLRDSYRWSEAEALYLKALAVNSDEVEANSQYGQFLMRAGYLEEALPFSAKARELEPLSAVKNIIYGWNLIVLGRFDEAVPVVETAMNLAPNFDLNNFVKFRQLVLTGRIEDGESYLVQRVRGLGGSQNLINASRKAFQLTVSGQRQRALEQIRTCLQIARDESFDANWNYAEQFSVLANHNGDTAFALELYLQRQGADGRKFFDSVFLWSPDYSELRKDRRFLDVVERSGLMNLWLKRGAPDRCLPSSGGSFSCD